MAATGMSSATVCRGLKERVGDFKNAGRKWRPQGRPEKVRVHDFPDPKVKKAIPYGVYDLTRNESWVSVGIDPDTARFATASIERWWRTMDGKRYPRAKDLLITADCGGATAVGRSCGRWLPRNWPTIRGSGGRFATSCRARASGTKSRTACSATLRRTGVGVLWPATRSWSNSSSIAGRRPDWRFEPNWTSTNTQGRRP